MPPSDLYHTATSAPAPLPFRIHLSDGRTRTDPSTFTPAEIADAGFVASPPKPDHDPENERVVWQAELSDWVIEPIPPAPPRVLSPLEFTRLGQTAGGMSDAQLAASRNDPQLEVMWIKMGMAKQIEHDDADVQAALAALEALGYLPNGAQAVLDAWPA